MKATIYVDTKEYDEFKYAMEELERTTTKLISSQEKDGFYLVELDVLDCNSLYQLGRLHAHFKFMPE